jgi:alternate signal-mediated exported protein
MTGQHRLGGDRRSAGDHRRTTAVAGHRRARTDRGHVRNRRATAKRRARDTQHHAGDRPAKRDISGRVIAVLGLLGALVITLGGQGTYAYWTDLDGVSGGSFSSGTLDLTVDGVQGNPSSYVKTNLALGSMVPGESAASTLAVANVGAVDFTWTATVTTGGGLGPAFVVEIYANSAQSGDDTTYPRNEGCTSTATPITSGTTSTRLNKSTSVNVCVKVTLPTNTGNAFQNQSTGSVSVAIAATQALS